MDDLVNTFREVVLEFVWFPIIILVVIQGWKVLKKACLSLCPCSFLFYFIFLASYVKLDSRYGSFIPSQHTSVSRVFFSFIDWFIYIYILLKQHRTNKIQWLKSKAKKLYDDDQDLDWIEWWLKSRQWWWMRIWMVSWFSSGEVRKGGFFF